MASMIYRYLTILTAVVITQVTASCPRVCECAREPPVCHPGVSVVPDGCGCCKVCAMQLNQDCNSMRPCDHHKGLECNYGNDVSEPWGICRAKSEGRTCEYKGTIYQNGESFHAGCKHQCTCIDGAVGCAPLCNNKLPPASPSCPYPQLIRVPGQCCLSVDCLKGIWRLPAKQQVPPPQQRFPKPQHHAYPDQRENEPANKLSDIKSSHWENEHGSKHLFVPHSSVSKKCPIQTTDWSQCSRSCGIGISSRITNNNPRCKMERQTRICAVRPCHALNIPHKKRKKCTPTQKAKEPTHLSYRECVSVRLYRPNYCGVCTDGWCCSPRHMRTVPVTFVCPDGERFQKSAMFIQSCKCSNDCGHLNEVGLPPQHWMYGDTHKFTD
ncbi:CCN family member 1-like [Antennarius striatus]|uniref:CCN family member 1-like n=1 Tax=Antennarius striatus TaxID=241820 RepID=UPI0035B42311